MSENIYRFLSLDNTLAKELFDKYTHHFTVIDKLSEYITKIGNDLDKSIFISPKKDVWIAKSATVADSVQINGPCIIDEKADIRHCAYIRGSAIIGKECVLGNSCEIKNSILFDAVQAPHYNYIGDSILGYKAHLGASAITSNVKSDKSTVICRFESSSICSNRKKLGAFIGDRSEIGCGAVLAPGAIIGNDVTVYPLTFVRGFIAPSNILKNDNDLTPKR